MPMRTTASHDTLSAGTKARYSHARSRRMGNEYSPARKTAFETVGYSDRQGGLRILGGSGYPGGSLSSAERNIRSRGRYRPTAPSTPRSSLSMLINKEGKRVLNEG